MQEELAPLYGFTWKQIVNSLMYIRCPDKLLELKGKGLVVSENDDGILVICFVNHLEGLYFSVVASAHIEDNKLLYGEINEKQFIGLSYFQLKNYPCLTQDLIEVKLETFYPDVLYIIEQFEKPYEQALEMREISELDNFRNPVNPDEIEILFLGEKIDIERAWVRSNRIGEKCLYGTLVNEPEQNVGFHKNDEIDFIIVEKDGKLVSTHIVK